MTASVCLFVFKKEKKGGGGGALVGLDLVSRDVIFRFP